MRPFFDHGRRVATLGCYGEGEGRTPIGRGFYAARGVKLLTAVELDTFAMIMQWAAVGCLHENRSALGAQLTEDAAWLRAQYSDRVRRMLPEARR